MPFSTLLRSPPVDWALMKTRNTVLGCLQYGPIPEHIAFIMDGNRRYAREQKMETVEGHHLGFEALATSLAICYQAGVRCVTVYAFSIENFKRPKGEVEGLMDMAMVKLSQLSRQGDILDRFGVRMQFLGDVSLIRKDVLEVIEKCTNMTKDNNLATLNICAPYTSREEISASVRKTVIDYTRTSALPLRRGPFSESRIARHAKSQTLGSVAEEDEDQAGQGTRHSSISSTQASELFENQDGTASNTEASPTTPSVSSPPSPHRRYPDPENITTETLTDNMYTWDCPPVDILIRTSGVNRLSDFLLWQVHEKSDFIVVETLWPAFGFWNICKIILEWQWKKRTQTAQELVGMFSSASGVRA